LKTDFTSGGTSLKTTAGVNNNSNEDESDVKMYATDQKDFLDEMESHLIDAELKEKAFKDAKENLLQMHPIKCSEPVSFVCIRTCRSAELLLKIAAFKYL